MKFEKNLLNYRKNSFFIKRWVEKIIALIVLVNYGLVIFDSTYIPLRDFWLQGRVQMYLKIGNFEVKIPKKPLKILCFNLTKYYDWVKGIEANRDTEKYLKTINELDSSIVQIVTQAGDPIRDKKIDVILYNLRQQSIDIIEENPFQIADKTGTLERIKNKMREHVFDSKDVSAKKSFIFFWNQKNWHKNGLRNELDFFDSQIKPLLETNYFRSVGENGKPINNFGVIDFPFSIIFFVELMVRSRYISRRHIGVNWFDAMLWRWYDIFLLIPSFRWLRIIPLIIRLDQSDLVNIKVIKKQVSQGFVAGIARDIIEVVVIQVINQVQSSIQEGTIRNVLTSTNTNAYFDFSDINEIAKLVSYIFIKKVIPEIRLEAEVFIEYSLNKVLIQTTAYHNLENLPGFKYIQSQFTKNFVSQLYQGLSEGLKQLLIQDSKFDELFEKLVHKFTQTMTIELQEKQSIDQIEILLNNLLEKFKVNYVERISAEDIEQILEQTRVLHQEAKTTSS